MTYGNNLYISPKGIHMVDSRGTDIIIHHIKISDRDTIQIFKAIRAQYTVQITTEKNGFLHIPRVKRVYLMDFEKEKEPLLVTPFESVVERGRSNGQI